VAVLAIGSAATAQLSTFQQLASSTTDADLQSAIVEIAYLGPVEKMQSTFDVTGGVDLWRLAQTYRTWRPLRFRQRAGRIRSY
jgi:hypothetical protein